MEGRTHVVHRALRAAGTGNGVACFSEEITLLVRTGGICGIATICARGTEGHAGTGNFGAGSDPRARHVFAGGVGGIAAMGIGGAEISSGAVDEGALAYTDAAKVLHRFTIRSRGTGVRTVPWLDGTLLVFAGEVEGRTGVIHRALRAAGTGNGVACFSEEITLLVRTGGICGIATICARGTEGHAGTGNFGAGSDPRARHVFAGGVGGIAAMGIGGAEISSGAVGHNALPVAANGMMLECRINRATQRAIGSWFAVIRTFVARFHNIIDGINLAVSTIGATLGAFPWLAILAAIITLLGL